MLKYLEKINIYLRESFAELRKVSWLSFNETIKITTDVIVFAAVFTIFFAIIEIIFLGIIFIR